MAKGARVSTLGHDVPGATVPAGFCMREFVTLPSPRVMALAPNGDLFVSTPSQLTPGGIQPG